MSYLFDTIRAYTGYQPTGSFTFTLLIGTAVFALSLGVLAVAASLASPVRRRLDRVSGGADTDAAINSRLIDRLRPLLPYVIPTKEKERSRVSKLLVHAGWRGPSAMPLFYASKALLTFGLPVLVLFSAAFLPRVSSNTILFAAVTGAMLGFITPGIWLE